MATLTSQQIDVYKTSYDIGATRYDNIYKSAWTIFSYMTAVSAGILSFGASRFYGQPLTVLACLPLIFWFWTTYLPLDRYGNNALKDLQRLEGIFRGDGNPIEIRHFTSFNEARTKLYLRARFSICVFIVVLHVAFVWGAYSSIMKLSNGDSLQKPPAQSAMVQLPG